MNGQGALGLLAILLGIAAGVVLFVPFVAISYRRRGGLTFGRLLLWAAALVYFWAIWTYTLLPLPDPDALRCVAPNLNLLTAVDDIRSAAASPGSMLTDPRFLQLAFNVLLFVPLGFFVRVLGGRGILVAFVVGFVVSLFVETTQLTGVWGLYPCAYRHFDVVDLATNTLGALLGSVAGFVVPRRHRGSRALDDADEPRPVTRGRRLLAMLCDVVGATLVQLFVGVGVQLGLELIGRRDIVAEGTIGSLAGALAALVAWLIVVLATGRTIGDLAVELRYAGGPVPQWLARPLRWLGGVGGFLLAGALPSPWSLAAWVVAGLGIVLAFTTEHGRGLPGLLSGQRLEDAREPESVVPVVVRGRTGVTPGTRAPRP